jgi:signal peptidase II
MIVVIDQWSKWSVVKTVDLYTSTSVIKPFFYITSHRNRGAAFGILQNERLFFIIVTLFVVCMLGYYLWRIRSGHIAFRTSLALVMGGAIGNLIDRIRLGEVVDFLDFRFGEYHFPVFNLADSAIVIGVGILAFLSIFYPKLMSEEKDTII